jgi:acetyl esterase
MPLHPFIESMLQKMAGRPGLSDGSPDQGRAVVAAGREALGKGPDMHSVQTVSVRTRGASVPVRIFQPSASPIGQIVYMHGGGWVIGTLDDYDAYARALSAASNCTTLLVDYRLAPEHRYPAGLEDCEDVVRWAAAQGPGSGLPLVIAGDSAGGNLATIVARRLRGSVPVMLQVLYYPVTDCDFSVASYGSHGEGLPITTKDMQWFFSHYAPAERWIDADISPLRSDDLHGLPPAIVVTAEYDVLCDEGEAYARKLKQAGVPVTVRRIEGTPHGFVRLHNLYELAGNELKTVAGEIAQACRATRST